MHSLSLLWEKDGTPVGVVCESVPESDLGYWTRQTAQARALWANRIKLPIFLRLSPLAWEELCELSSDPSALLEMRKDFEGFQFITPDPALIGRERSGALQRIKSAGLKCVLGRFALKAEMIALLPHSAGCELSATELGRDLCANLSLRLAHANHWCFISQARGLTDVADLARLGAGPFHGQALFSRAFASGSARIDMSTLRALRLVGMIYAQAELSEIEQEIKEDPGLSYKLISIINSAGLRSQRAVGTVREALMILGYAQLALWISLLLLSSTPKRPQNQSLRFSLLLRAKLSELIIARSNPDLAESAFVCGLFSNLDALLDAPLDELVGKAHLPARQREAILTHKGPIGQAVKIAKAMDTDPQIATALLREAAIDRAEASQMMHQALLYALSMHPLGILGA